MKKTFNLITQLIEASQEKDRQDRIKDPEKIGDSFFTFHLKNLMFLAKEEYEAIEKEKNNK
jgi:hypothetical protein